MFLWCRFHDIFTVYRCTLRKENSKWNIFIINEKKIQKLQIEYNLNLNNKEYEK